MMRAPAERLEDNPQRRSHAPHLAFARANDDVLFDGVHILNAPGLVMTPSSTTEALVDWAVGWIGSRPLRVADVGTGSGAVAVAVALRAPASRIWATDDDAAAVALARANVTRHGLHERVRVLLGNLLDPVPGQLDLVVANLPYHSQARSRGHARSACRDQPKHAIYAPGDGLGYYRDLLEACQARLTSEGALAIQLYGSILTAGRGQLDLLSQEMERRADEHNDMGDNARSLPRGRPGSGPSKHLTLARAGRSDTT
jgi:methylase of polypeptide subunit release factors